MSLPPARWIWGSSELFSFTAADQAVRAFFATGTVFSVVLDRFIYRVGGSHALDWGHHRDEGNIKPPPSQKWEFQQAAILIRSRFNASLRSTAKVKSKRARF